MQKRVTSQDVADRAGVSRTTVSFVLNDVKRFSIRPETRAKVHQAAQELGYVPNASARALASDQAKAIGLIITRNPRYISSDPFLSQIIAGLIDVTKADNLSLLIELVEVGQQARVYQDLTKSKHIDGMILMTPRFDDAGLKAIEEYGIPAVLMGHVPGSKLYAVDVDNVASAKMAVDHLIANGHTQIACITNAPSPYSSAYERLQGYRQALKEAGLPYSDQLIRHADFDPESGYTQMQDLLASRQAFTAVFVASDNVALGAIQAIHAAGLTIPGDISVVGFDNLPFSAFTNPPLTTVDMPSNEIAKESCHLLMRLMKGDAPESHMIKLPTELVTRASVRALKA